jgi:REP element-mobilizing transposase RayT
MPNHFHAIIIIGNNKYNSDTNTNPDTINTTKNKFGPQSKNLASVIRGFKIGVTKNARQINPGFAWQSRYHDHIIRNDKSFKRIQDYIINNPKNWDNDKFY